MSTESESTVKVWDPLVRIFHWSLALFFVVSYVTSGDEDSVIHPLSGYAIVTLVVIRIVWGFVGPKYARFSDFVYPRSQIVGYAKGLLNKDAPRFLGHNPLGGLMIVVLLASLAITTTLGMLYYGADEKKGPLAGVFAEQSITLPAVISSARADDDEGGAQGHKHKHNKKYKPIKELHEFFGNFTLFLVIIHLGGVIVESVFHKESLVKAMLSGRKRA
jgi:cytochrome b